MASTLISVLFSVLLMLFVWFWVWVLNLVLILICFLWGFPCCCFFFGVGVEFDGHLCHGFNSEFEVWFGFDVCFDLGFCFSSDVDAEFRLDLVLILMLFSVLIL